MHERSKLDCEDLIIAHSKEGKELCSKAFAHVDSVLKLSIYCKTSALSPTSLYKFMNIKVNKVGKVRALLASAAEITETWASHSCGLIFTKSRTVAFEKG